MANLINKIDSEADRQRALEEIERLSDAKADSEPGRYRDLLLDLVAQYEAKGRPGYGQVS